MVVRMVTDAALIQLALIAALVARLMVAVVFQNSNAEEVFRPFVGFYAGSAWKLTTICLLVFYLNGFYTYGHHYQGRYKAIVVSNAVFLSFLIFAFANFFFTQGDRSIWLPRAALILAWLFTTLLLVGARIWNQLWTDVVDMEREAYERARTGGPRRILVIGGAGYIGSALLTKLLDRGYRIRLLDVLLFGHEPIEHVVDNPNLEIVEGDFRHVENVVAAMRDVDSVVHLGAIVGDPACNLDENLTIDVNLSATRMIAELAKAAGVDRFVFASTCSVYGVCEEVLDERSQVRPVSLYGHTKLASEQVLRGMAGGGFNPIILRFSTIYGLSGRTRFDLVVNLLTAKAKIDGEITVFGGDQWRPFVHVDDAAAAIAMVLDAPLPIVSNEIFNVGSKEQNYTIDEIGRIVQQHVHTAKLKISGNDGDRRNYRVSFKKIHNVLGFEPRWTLEMGIQQVLESIADGRVTDYRDSKYSNVKFLSEEGTARLTNDWARNLIKELSSQ